MKGWQRAILIIIPYIVVVGLLQFIASLVYGVNILDSKLQLKTYEELIFMIPSLIGTFLIIGIFIKYIDRCSLLSLGFDLKKRRTDILIGFTIGFLIMFSGFLILDYSNEIIIRGINFNIMEIFYSLILFLIIAIVEEVLFRGYILNNLMLSINKYYALFLTSFIFSLLHFFNPNFSWISLISIFLAGLVLGISYIYTKNLWLPISLHFSWNLFQSLFGFNVSGKDYYSIIELSIKSENHFNGGKFGYENSIMLIIAEIITLIFLFYYRKPKNNINKTIVNNG